MNWILGAVATILFIMGLVGQGFEMRKMRTSARTDKELASTSIFFSKKNLKWFILIGAGFALWYIAEPMPP
jgi:hypothetical protein